MTYSYTKNKLNYRYSYNITTGYLEVLVYDENNTEIENYKYDTLNNKVINCFVGRCNDYKEAMNLLNKDLLYLFE